MTKPRLYSIYFIELLVPVPTYTPDLHKNRCLDPDPQKNTDPDPAGKFWQYFLQYFVQVNQLFYRFLLISSKKY
jgi:hypothetical protein